MVSTYDQQVSHISVDTFFSMKLVNELLPLTDAAILGFGRIKWLLNYCDFNS
jgi:hypothetical protein